MSHALLTVDEVWKRFGGRSALAGISLTVGVGEALGIIGPNGSGKSTLLNVISRLADPDAGRVRFGGEDVLAMSAGKLASAGVTRVFQVPRLSGQLTVVENVALGMYGATGVRQRLVSPIAGDLSRRDRSRVMQLLEAVGLAEGAQEWPEALTHYQLRCAELARALAPQPRLLLLDEPTAGFSQEERTAFLGLIQLLRGAETSIILIEHNFELILRACERVVVLDAGRLVASGPPSVVRADPAVLSVYFGGAHA